MIVAVIVLLFFAIVIANSYFSHRADTRDFSDFDTRFPPISDEQFLALCPSGTNPEIALKVRGIVAKQLAVPYAQIYPSSRFYEDLGAD